MHNKKGMTLVELMVAMVVAAISLTIVFYMWNHINSHIAISKYKTQIETETNRIGLQIVNQIRKSPSIITWDNHRIQMVHHTTNDTLDYYFDETELLLNGKPIQLLVNNATVLRFEFSDINEMSGVQSESLFLEFTISIAGREKDTSTVRHTIQISQNVNKNEMQDNSFGF